MRKEDIVRCKDCIWWDSSGMASQNGTKSGKCRYYPPKILGSGEPWDTWHIHPCSEEHGYCSKGQKIRKRNKKCQLKK